MIKYINEYKNGMTVRTVAEFNSEDYKSFIEFELAYKSKIVELNATHTTYFRDSPKCCNEWNVRKYYGKSESSSEPAVATKPAVAVPQTVSKSDADAPSVQVPKVTYGDFPEYDAKTNTIRINNFATRNELVKSCAKSLSTIIEIMDEQNRPELIKDMALPAIEMLYLLQVV